MQSLPSARLAIHDGLPRRSTSWPGRNRSAGLNESALSAQGLTGSESAETRTERSPAAVSKSTVPPPHCATSWWTRLDVS